MLRMAPRNQVNIITQKLVFHCIRNEPRSQFASILIEEQTSEGNILEAILQPQMADNISDQIPKELNEPVQEAQSTSDLNPIADACSQNSFDLKISNALEPLEDEPSIFDWIAEKTKDLVDTMIVTLDPGMKDYICNY